MNMSMPEGGAPQGPQLPKSAHNGIMSGTTLHTLPQAAARLHARGDLRKHGDAAPRTSAHATRAAAPRAAARQRRPCAAKRAPAALASPLRASSLARANDE